MNKMKIAGILCLLFSGVLFFSVLVEKSPETPSSDPKNMDPLFAMFGSAREAAGDLVFMKADSYLHAGLRTDYLEEASEDDHDGEESHEALGETENGPPDWVQQIYSQVRVSEHKHLEGAESKEMLPILDTATQLNPHNVTAVLSAAYWMQSRFSDPERALEILRKGRQDNPDVWEIDFEIGQIYLNQKKDHRLAADFLNSALLKMEPGRFEPFDAVRVRYYLAESFKLKGSVKTARIFYKEALHCYPAGRESVLKKTIEKELEISLAGNGILKKAG